jgi:hypothetical protein
VQKEMELKRAEDKATLLREQQAALQAEAERRKAEVRSSTK